MAYDLGPKPKFVEGGCLCSSLRYRIDFPEDHDFGKNSCTCQCTLCRKCLSSLFFLGQSIPLSSFKWLAPNISPPDEINSVPNIKTSVSDTNSTLKLHSARKGSHRAFCGNCGSVLYWRCEGSERVTVLVGTIDPLYLMGEGVAPDDVGGVPEDGFGRALGSGLGMSEFCANEIKGVTDEIPLLFRGRRFEGSGT